MRGKIDIRIYDKRLEYIFSVKRKVTIVNGDSGTGKTTMLRFLSDALNGYGGKLLCSRSCVVLNSKWWFREIEENKSTIFFVDEYNKFIFSEEFASCVKRSDGYFIIVSRRELHNIPYSVYEIYNIFNQGKVNYLVPTYDFKNKEFKVNTILTEDSNSGYQFFSRLCKDCIGAGGYGNVYKRLEYIIKNSSGGILLVVDLAAFGAYIKDILSLTSKYSEDRCMILNIESFEEMLLRGDLFARLDKLKPMLEHPEDYIDQSQFSWENYFFDLLKGLLTNTSLAYSKDKINACFVQDCCFRRENCEFYLRGDKLQLMLGRFKDLLIFHEDNKKAGASGKIDPIRKIKSF